MGQAVLQGLAKHLVKEAHISEKDALKALEAANKEGPRLCGSGRIQPPDLG